MYNNQYMIENLTRQKDRINEMIKNYQQPQPINNFINTQQIPSNDLVILRILNENEEVDNLYVNNKTLFINEKMMVLKGVDGKLEKWEIKKVYPIDEKDKKINELEEEIEKLKEMVKNGNTKSDLANEERNQPDGNVNVNATTKSKAVSKSVSK